MKKNVITPVTALIAASLLTSYTARAQDTGRSSQFALEEIVVTAQKRETSLQSTPVAISAFAGETMEDRGIDDLANFQSYVPGLHIGEEQGGFKISLRGIGLQGTSSISDSGVAFYIDNNYIARPSGGSAVFHDIERIEVLRGPQGTLYGRNATGGVVNVISKQPVDEFEGEVSIGYGSRNLTEVKGVVNMPIADTVAGRLSAVYTEEDGYVENESTQPGTDDFFGTNGDTSIRGQLLFTPANAEVLISATYSDLDGTGVNMAYLERNIGGPGPTQALLATLPVDSTDPLKTDNDSPAFNKTETTSAFARATVDINSMELFVQASYLDQTSNILQDFDGSALNISIFNKDQDTTAESLEVRLASDSSSALTWIVGGYYFSEDTYIFRRVRLNGLAGGNFINLPDFLLDEDGTSETLAVFGTTTYSLTSDFRISLGLRYTEDEKSGTKVTRGNFGQPFPDDIPNTLFPFYPGKADFSKTTGRLGIEWDMSDDVFVYATVSNGYKAGGFNLTSNGLPYDPETITAYEFGVKSDLWDGRARINLDTFYYDYQDLQLTTLTTVNNAPGQFTTNAAESTIFGAELETQFALTENLQLTATYSYINAEFDELFSTDTRDPSPVFNPTDPAGLGREDLSGNKIPYVSENTINIGLQYEVELGSAGSLITAINVAWRDDLYLREYNNSEIDLVEDNTKTDITATYLVGGTNLSLTAYVTNLEDDVQKTNVFVSPGFVGLSGTTAYTKPRTVGLRLDYTF